MGVALYVEEARSDRIADPRWVPGTGRILIRWRRPDSKSSAISADMLTDPRIQAMKESPGGNRAPVQSSIEGECERFPWIGASSAGRPRAYRLASIFDGEDQ